MKQSRTRRIILALVHLFSCGLLLPGFVPSAAAQRLPAIQVIDDSDRIRLGNTTHPLVRNAVPAGPADPALGMDRMLLVLGPGDEVQQELRTLLDSQHDKKSRDYHKWITPEQFGARFGPAQQDIDKVVGWLQQKGFQQVKVARGRGSIEFSGTAQQVEIAFGTKMRYYQVDGAMHLANATEISIPKGMSGVVRGVNLENFSFSKPQLKGFYPVARGAGGELARIDPQFQSGGVHFLAPGDYSKIYDLASLNSGGIDGSGVTIAVVARSNILLSDIETFRQTFNLPAKDPNIILNGQDPGYVLGGDFIEASLDAQWTGAVAPNATVDVVVSGSTQTTDGVILSSLYIVDNNLADIMSMSFSSCEQQMGSFNAFFNALYQQAAAEGISVFVASGDDGAADCDAATNTGSGPATGGLAVNGLASTPFNTAVGGTQFNEGGTPSTYWDPINGLGQASAFGYIPEVVWNESCDPTKTACPPFNIFSLDAGGGGVSTIYSKPSWQSAGVTGVPNDNQRDLPDVSLTAAVHDSYLFCAGLFAPCTTDGGLLLQAGAVGGTSASVQAFAGMMALVDQKQGGRQGLANYVLYQLAANQSFANCNSNARTNPNQPAPASCVFNDITSGNNGVPGNDTLIAPVPPGDLVGQLGYNALSGFDPATGLGSVNAAKLVNAWSTATFQGSITTLSASGAVSIQHGQPFSFSGTVNSLAAPGTPTGPFVLIAKDAPPPFTGTAVASGVLSNGAFSGTVNSLPGGQYNLVAHYGGDTVFGGSESNVVAVNVGQESSRVLVAAIDENNATVSAPGTLTVGYGLNGPIDVTVQPTSFNGVPTGTVALMDGGVTISQLPLNNEGHARFIDCDPLLAPFCLSMGTHNLTVAYSGDPSLTPSKSAALTYNINKGNVAFFAIFFFRSDNTLEIEADFDTGAAVMGTPPTGTVSFTDTVNGATSALGPPISLSQGLSIFREFNLAAGTHVLSAQYSGDNNYLPTGTTSTPITLAPLPPLLPVQIRLTAPASAVVGQNATFTIQVFSPQSANVPTGAVELLAGATFIDGQELKTLSNGSVTFQGIVPNAFPVLQALYVGDSNFASGYGPPVQYNVSKATPALSITSNMTNIQAGTQVSLVGTIVPPLQAQTPQNLIQFFDSVNGAPPVPLGAAQIILPASSVAPFKGKVAIPAILASGVHSITAKYTGDDNYSAVSSNAITVSVSSPPVFGFTTPVGGDAITITSGQSGTFNVAVNGNGFVGTVSLSCGGAPAKMTCSASPQQVNLTNTVTTVNVVVTVAPITPATAQTKNWLLGLGIAFGLVLLRFRRKPRAGATTPSGAKAARIGDARAAVACLALVCLIASMGACGGSGAQTPPPPTPTPTPLPTPTPPPPPSPTPTPLVGPGSYAITLTGTSGSTSNSMLLTLTVKP